MATILIVEDRPVDRKLLATILRSAHHKVLEAADGVEALRSVEEGRPHLIISDILMPTMDGYEFVRRLREIPAFAATPVIFYTATYHEREARSLAHRCGVVDILVKPSAARTILATVDAALASKTRGATPPMDAEAFAREHQRVIDSASGAESQRLTAVLDISRQLVEERDPVALFNKVCAEARDVTLAGQAIVGLFDANGVTDAQFFTSGVDNRTAGNLAALSGADRGPERGRPTRRPVRVPARGGSPSLLRVPIASTSRVYGWLSLRGKLGTDEFSEADASAALTLGTHAGLAYEHAQILHDSPRRGDSGGRRHPAASAGIRQAREEERARLARTLHDRLGQELAALKMDLHWLSAHLRSEAGTRRGALSHRLQAMRASLDRAVLSLRSIAGDLRPGVLDHLGLRAAIESHAAEWERQSGMRCRVEAPAAPVALERDAATAVFRIVQEALSNVQRHAHASRVTISIRQSGRQLTIAVADDGRGVTPRDVASPDSLGLVGMRERAELLHGTLTIRRRRPAGTVVTVVVPVADAAPRTRGHRD